MNLHYDINVVNVHTHGNKAISGVYIGRGSVLGNPYTHLSLEKSKAQFKVESREAAIEAYKHWLDDKIANMDKDVINELNKILHIAQDRGVVLVCYCKPKACHGDYIKQVVEQKIQNNEVF